MEEGDIMIHSMVFAIVILGAMVGATQAQLIEKKALTLEGAKRIVPLRKPRQRWRVPGL